MTAITADPALMPAAVDAVCAHCGLPAPSGRRFCCPGCSAAFETIEGLGLGSYYRQRLLDPAQRAPRPDATDDRALARSVLEQPDGTCELSLAIDGLQCGACVWLIESVLAREPAVRTGRVNMTTRRLKLVWSGAAADADRFVALIERLGYRLVPFDPRALSAAQDRTGKALLRALGVAGFAAGNVMLMSIGIWLGQAAGWLDGMGSATRDLLHWFSALIALPAIAYAGIPFFSSAAAALRQCRTNMDVPISIGVSLVTVMSLVENLRHGEHTYYDSAITLLFFLLIGRVLDHRARGQARATAEQLLTLRATDVAVLQDDGSVARRAQQAVRQGDRVLVGMGERVGVDGVVERGTSLLDTSLVTGESVPAPIAHGSAVFAGTLNLGEPLTVRATATGETTLLAECVRLIDAAEARRSRFVVLADRVARRYAPTVHLAALATFLLWYVALAAPLAESLMTAAAVLIITCPCALALAVPAVQVIVTSGLFRRGVLLKSPTALERLAEVDTVVFDKTGTLTEPSLSLVRDGVDGEALLVAASLAASSRHPLARSLLAAAGPVPTANGVIEHAGLGLSAGEVRLGNWGFAAKLTSKEFGQSETVPVSPADEPPRPGSLPQGEGEAVSPSCPELWLTRPGHPAVRFAFDEHPRTDAAASIAALRALGVDVRLISGDRPGAVARIAASLGISDWRAGCSPVDKVAAIEALAAHGRRVLMVGDGLNDSPSLAAAHVSASPASAADVSQTVADVVFQGALLAPVVAVIQAGRRARTIMRQNLILSIGYNVLMVPLAVAGYVTPWLAAAAMSSSSILVISNSFRARGRRDA